jgi:hypothetical protein
VTKARLGNPRAIATGLVVASVVGAYFILRPNPWDVALSTAADALRTHSPERLYPFVTAAEQEAGLTEEKWVKLYQRLIEPRLKKVTIEGPDDRSSKATTTQIVSYPVRLQNGVQYSVAVGFDFGNTGARANLMNLLGQAWAIDYLQKYPKELHNPRVRFDAFYWGLKQDLPVLKELGIDRYASGDPLDGARTWEQILATENRSSKTPLTPDSSVR